MKITLFLDETDEVDGEGEFQAKLILNVTRRGATKLAHVLLSSALDGADEDPVESHSLEIEVNAVVSMSGQLPDGIAYSPDGFPLVGTIVTDADGWNFPGAAWLDGLIGMGDAIRMRSRTELVEFRDAVRPLIEADCYDGNEILRLQAEARWVLGEP